MSRSRANQQKSKTIKRRLFAEQLEARLTLDGNGYDGDFYLDPPPASYLDDDLAMEVSRLAWEFDEWNKSDIARGRFEQSEDRRVSIEDGHALLAFVAKEVDSNLLLQEFEPLHIRVSASIDERTSAWVPLASLNSLKDLRHARLVYFELLQSSTQSHSSVSQNTSTPKTFVLDATVGVELSPPIIGIDMLALAPNWSPQLSGTLFEIWQRGQESTVRERSAVATKGSDPIYEVDGDRVLILAASATHTGAELAKGLTSLGATVTAHSEFSVNAWVPVNVLPELGNLPELTIATAETRGKFLAGSVDTQGDALMRANDLRTRYGFQGNGQSIAVISDSYNRLVGAAADVASNDLWPVTVVAESQATTNSDEGRAMLQIVHDIASNANLLFATALGGQNAFANNIQAVFNAGARVFVDDVLDMREPMFLDGIVAQRVDSVTSQGAIYVSAAGNFRMRSYETTGFAASNVSLDSDPSGSGTSSKLRKAISVPCISKFPGSSRRATTDVSVKDTHSCCDWRNTLDDALPQNGVMRTRSLRNLTNTKLT